MPERQKGASMGGYRLYMYIYIYVYVYIRYIYVLYTYMYIYIYTMFFLEKSMQALTGRVASHKLRAAVHAGLSANSGPINIPLTGLIGACRVEVSLGGF